MGDLFSLHLHGRLHEGDSFQKRGVLMQEGHSFTTGSFTWKFM